MYRSGKGLRKTVFFLVFLVSVLLVSGSSHAADRSFWRSRGKNIQSTSGTKSPLKKTTQTQIDPLEIEIPEQYGAIIETHRGSNGKLIIHIQDAHSNYEGQINAAGILESLIENYDLNLILKESKITDRDFKYLRDRASLDERREIADGLLRDGYITGVNYLDLASDYPVKIQGIEDKGLYDENRNALWEIDRFKDLAAGYVDKLIVLSGALKPHIYNQDLLALDGEKKAYDAERTDLVTYYKYLYEKAEEKDIPMYLFPNFSILIKAEGLEKVIDLTKIHEGKASDEELRLYDEYMGLTKDLDINGLFKEEPMLQEALEAAMATNPDQERLIRISKALSIMNNLLAIKVVPEEYKYFTDNKEDFDPEFWSDFLKEKSKELGFSLSIPDNYYIISDNLPKIERFYRIAAEREEVFLKRTEDHMNKEGVNLAALVAGGFHTPTLTRLLADAGYSYVVVSPRVTTKTDDERYRWALKMNWLKEIEGGAR